MSPETPSAAMTVELLGVSEKLLVFRRAVTECQNFLAALEQAIAPVRLPAPRLVVSRDGEEIALSWTQDNQKIEIGFVGDGQYSCYAIYPDGTTYGTRGPLLDGFPEEVIRALRLGP